MAQEQIYGGGNRTKRLADYGPGPATENTLRTTNADDDSTRHVVLVDEDGTPYTLGGGVNIVVVSNAATLLSNASATGSGVAWLGGMANYVALASAWNSASLKLQVLGPDGSTYVDLDDTTLSANGGRTGLDLAPGTYKAVITGSPTGVYCTLKRSA